jgi:hypothetical protein
VHYLNARLKVKYTEWDHKTTTITDYAVKYEIPDRLYDWFVDNVYEENEEYNSHSQIYAFKMFLKDEITKMLKLEDPVVHDDDEKLGIVDIQFTFKYFRLIPLMMQRGKAIWDERHFTRTEIEEKIIKNYSSKQHKQF